MNLTETQYELLLRSLDRRLGADERAELESLLRSSAAAREFLREVAEQAVVVADTERAALGREAAIMAQYPGPATRQSPNRSWPWYGGMVLAVAAIVSVAAWSAWAFRPAKRSLTTRIAKLTGSCNYFDAVGTIGARLQPGALVGAGDMLKTRSCDAWITLETLDGTTATIAGNTALRILDPGDQQQAWDLLQGCLWVTPSAQPSSKSLAIHTACGEVLAQNAQLDIQAAEAEMVVRVNSGQARVVAAVGGAESLVRAGEQLRLQLGVRQPLVVEPQAKPVKSWTCDLEESPEVLLGKWLPRRENSGAALGAEPLLWPIDEQRKIMLYAVSFAAWKSSRFPVQLRSNSTLRFRGRTLQPHTVRFGFSAQKMRGVFAGKFEVDVRPAELGAAGDVWEIHLPLSAFQPLYPQLAATPDLLELTDVYALTVETDVGLEIHHIELVAAETADERPSR